MMTGSSNNNVQSKVTLKCSMTTGSWICTVQSKLVKYLLKGSRVTGLLNNNVQSKVSLKRRQVDGDYRITMFTVKYLSKAT
jgi:hypothetical protein